MKTRTFGALIIVLLVVILIVFITLDKQDNFVNYRVSMNGSVVSVLDTDDKVVRKFDLSSYTEVPSGFEAPGTPLGGIGEAVLGVNKVYVVVEDNWQAGTFGTPGRIVKLDIETGDISEISIGHNIYDVSVSPSGDYLAYPIFTGEGSCSAHLGIRVIDTFSGDEIPISLEPTIEGYLADQNYDGDQELDLGEQLSEHKWEKSNTLMFKRTILSNCLTETTLVQSWEYNLETGEYTLISAN